MNYKMLVYAAFVLLSIYGVSGLNLNSLFKSGKKYEAWIFVIMLSVAIGYLCASFIIDFLEVSKII